MPQAERVTQKGSSIPKCFFPEYGISRQKFSIIHTKSQFYKRSEVDKNSVVDKEAVVYQSVFTRVNREIASLPNSVFNTFLLQAPAD